MRLKGDAQSKRNARQLRRKMSLPEVLLWQQLRQSPGGHRFRRQHPGGPYDLDFYCAPARLAIEVDGEAHDYGDRPARDAERDAWLEGQGVRVLRISAKAVLTDLDAVIRLILASVDPLPPRPAGAVPLPRSDAPREDF
ncbi:MAG: endonuclease domain-containing protein [Sphingomonas sp.]|uniref:endonuclease domain-containing protein n=1 Tax=Sphingomonas sp. TaxID=28214 RepID=UPI0025CC71CF|nr:endonuclease domain-containing protein [Sphingomonas sp.]MBY0284666.1 endonuclease domain-containing protein [Sphingomonas sp.]